MTPNEVITEVRRLVSDTKATYRYSDSVLLGFVNSIIRRMVILRPDLFLNISDVAVTANSTLQSCPSGAVRLVEVFYTTLGGVRSAITETSRDVLDQTYPEWVAESPGTPVNYMRHVRNPTKFFVSPPPVAGVTLNIEYVAAPATYSGSDTIALPDAYFGALVDGTVFLTQSIDNEHVNSGRAKLFQDSFIQALGVDLQSRVVTDTEEAGLDPKQVV